MPSVTTDY